MTRPHLPATAQPGSVIARVHRAVVSGIARGEVSPVQLATTAILIVVAFITAEPTGTTGTGLAVELLLVANSVLLASRHLPAEVVGTRLRLVLLYLGVVAAAALLALSTAGIASVFGFFVAGHAGFRLTPDRAVPVAVCCSIVCGGVLLAHAGAGHRFTPWYVGAASGFAVVLGMLSRSRQDALQSARAAAAAAEQARAAAEQARESAERAARAEARGIVLAERGRIARDVHDVLAHSLAGINMQLEMADALMESGRPEQAREAARRAQSLVRESLAEAQRTVRALREDALPLLETIRAMLASFDPAAEPEVVGEPREIATPIAQALIRVAQESLTNAHKHAPGRQVTVRLTYARDRVELEVRNAPGAAAHRPLADTGSGMGLVGIRERIALVGGTVVLGPVLEGPDAGGWQVRVEIGTDASPHPGSQPVAPRPREPA